MIYLISNQLRNFDSDIQLTTLEHCLDYFKDKDIIEVDTETEGCKWSRGRLPDPFTSKVLCIQLGTPDDQFVIDTTAVKISELKELFEDKSKLKIFQNAFFDLRFIWHSGIEIENIYDIMLAETILTRGKFTPKGYKSLAGMAERYLGESMNKEVRGQIHWRGLDDTVIRYAAGDVDKMTRIREKQLVELKKWDLLDYLKLENRYAKDLSLMAYNGFKLNPDKWLEYNKLAKQKLIGTYNELVKYMLEHHPEKVQTTLFGTESIIDFNSPKQTQNFFEELGMDIMIRDKKTGVYKKSVELKHIMKQADEFPILYPYAKFKEAGKEISTYGEKFLKENLNPVTGRIHSEFYQILETGRLSSSSPNLQNIPGEDEKGNTHPLRLCFEPDEGNVFIVADYSQQEPRITADYSQDPYLIDFIINGSGDSHSLIATMISEYLVGEHVDVSKKNNPRVERYNKTLRAIGKMINLGLDYGKSAFSIKDDLKTSQDEAQRLLDIISSKTPKKTAYFKKWQKFVKANGFIRTDDVFRSKTWYSNYDEYLDTNSYSRRSKLAGEMERFAQNNRIQGTAALMTKLAQIKFNDKLKEKFKGQTLLEISKTTKIVVQVHDEFVAECKKEYAKEIAPLLKEVMEWSGNVFCKTIPMKVEPEIGLNWTH